MKFTLGELAQAFAQMGREQEKAAARLRVARAERNEAREDAERTYKDHMACLEAASKLQAELTVVKDVHRSQVEVLQLEIRNIREALGGERDAVEAFKNETPAQTLVRAFERLTGRKPVWDGKEWLDQDGSGGTHEGSYELLSLLDRIAPEGVLS